MPAGLRSGTNAKYEFWISMIDSSAVNLLRLVAAWICLVTSAGASLHFTTGPKKAISYDAFGNGGGIDRTCPVVAAATVSRVRTVLGLRND